MGVFKIEYGVTTRIFTPWDFAIYCRVSVVQRHKRPLMRQNCAVYRKRATQLNARDSQKWRLSFISRALNWHNMKAIYRVRRYSWVRSGPYMQSKVALNLPNPR